MPQPQQLLARKLSTFVTLSAAETRCLAALQAKPVRVKAGAALVREGDSGHRAYILQAGWACSFKLLPDGGRQIITFPLPGFMRAAFLPNDFRRLGKHLARVHHFFEPRCRL